jgi:hypothetical protein
LGRLIRAIEKDLFDKSGRVQDTKRVNALVYAYSTMSMAIEKREASDVIEKRFAEIERFVLAGSARGHA